MTAFIAPIVEGHGEGEALPTLLHRIARRARYPGLLRVNRPIRVKVGSFLASSEYREKYMALACAKAAQERNGKVLVLFDCDDECPARAGPRLSAELGPLRPEIPKLVALAHREYETWFVTAARSLRGRRGLPHDLDGPAAPEAIRDAKGWLGDRMDTPYDPVVHQAEFSRAFDLDLALANRSFERLVQRIIQWLGGED